MLKNVNKIASICFYVILFSGLCQRSTEPQAMETTNNQKISGKYSSLYVSLNEEFVLHENQMAKINNEDFEIKIVKFFNSPCPPDVMCKWSGVGMIFEYHHAGEVKQGINLVQAFDFQTVIIDSDYETYAKLKINKIVVSK